MTNYIKLIDFNDMTEQQDLPAGRFSSWLFRTRSALIKENGASVPCGKCTACCRSSQFIHIKPEETQTLSRIPKELLFTAPGLPEGNVLLGYDENGHCPMLKNETCSIYEHRPLTCRNYDCRIFTATGIEAVDDDKALITKRVQRWKFSYPTKRDRYQQSALRAAALFLRERVKCFPDGMVPSNTTQLAILAIKVYQVFIKYKNESIPTKRIFSDLKIAKAIMEANEKFEERKE